MLVGMFLVLNLVAPSIKSLNINVSNITTTDGFRVSGSLYI